MYMEARPTSVTVIDWAWIVIEKVRSAMQAAG